MSSLRSLASTFSSLPLNYMFHEARVSSRRTPAATLPLLSCHPVHRIILLSCPFLLSLYPVKRGVEKTDKGRDRPKDWHHRGQQLRRFGQGRRPRDISQELFVS